MSTPPQQVTSRYARNLLVKGENNEFSIRELQREFTQIDNVVVGYYYQVEIKEVTGMNQKAVGVTPEQAVHRCLEKHGVTFR